MIILFNINQKEVQTIDKPQKRSFELKKIIDVLGSFKPKYTFKAGTVQTSAGVTSDKKESKFTDELEKCVWVITSPAIKLDKRMPKKEISKESKASKNSKNSKKKAKRIPKKYSQANISKEKLSNKSLVNYPDSNQEPLIQDILIASENGNFLGTDRRGSMIKSKTFQTSRATVNLNNREIVNHGIIIEEQNESQPQESSESEIVTETIKSPNYKIWYSNDSNRQNEIDDDNSVSSDDESQNGEDDSDGVHSLNSNKFKLNIDPPTLMVAKSAPLGMMSSKSSTTKAINVKKIDYFSLKEAILAAPLPRINAHSAWRSHVQEEEPERISLCIKNEAFFSNKSIPDDVITIKQTQQERNKAILSKLRMMI